MLTRRHIRAKVMQSIYAFKQSNNNNLTSEEKFLRKSMDDMYDLFLLNLNLIVEVKNQAEAYLEISKKKFLATTDDKAPNLKFINNQVIKGLEDTPRLNELLSDRKLTHWSRDNEFPKMIWKDLKETEEYLKYIATPSTSFKEDKDFVLFLFKKILAPNEKLYDYYEDQKLTWIDDLPIVNTSILKFLQKLKVTEATYQIPVLFKSKEDEEFGYDLFRKTLLNQQNYLADMEGKTPGWEQDRIAEVDLIMICMGLCEFSKFPSIPVKVTINEYLELAKEYSTPKSSIFINGVLDKLSKLYYEEGKLNKMGRGLM